MDHLVGFLERTISYQKLQVRYELFYRFWLCLYSFVKLVAGKYCIAFQFHMIHKSLKIRLELLFIALSKMAPSISNVSSFLTTPYQQITTLFFLFLCSKRTTEHEFHMSSQGFLAFWLIFSIPVLLRTLYSSEIYSWWFIPLLTPCKVWIQLKSIEKTQVTTIQNGGCCLYQRRGSHNY